MATEDVEDQVLLGHADTTDDVRLGLIGGHEAREFLEPILDDDELRWVGADVEGHGLLGRRAGHSHVTAHGAGSIRRSAPSSSSVSK